MTRVGLTRKQRALFVFVEAEILADRPAPSFEEIQAHLGLASKSGVHRLVTSVVERGWLVRLPNKARSLALPGSARAEDLAAVAADRRADLDGKVSVDLGPTLASRLAAFCAERRRTKQDVVLEALDAHLRWPS